MCQCDFQDNIWVHDFSSMLLYIQDLPKTLSNLEDPSTKWILQQKCEEDASTYPNSVQPFDIHEVLQLQENDATTVHNSCLPGHLAMSMVCAQQWIAKKSLMGVVKWVSKMNELMTVVNVCMDQHSPVPFHLDDFTRYMERFAGGVPPPQHPAFVQSLAWPTKAVAKQASETAKAMLECLPLKDPSCFPRSSTNVFESCSQCCDLSHGPQGQERCWQDGFDFQRCCNAPVETSTTPAAETSNEEKNALKKSLDVEMKKVVELESVLKVQKENLKSCEDEKEGKVKELQSQEEVLKRLQEASDKKNTASDESGNALAALKAEKEKLESAASEVQKTLKKSLAEVEGQLKASEAKVKELTEASEKAATQNAGQTKIKEELEKLRGEMQKKEAEMQKKDAEVKKKDTEVQMKNAELEKQKAGMKKKEEEFEKKEAAMAKLETSMVAREKEAAAIAKKKEAELQKRLDEAQKQKEAEVQQLQAQLKEAQGKQGKPEVELQKTKEELKKSQQKSQQDAQELQKLRAEVENLKAAKGKEKNAELETMKANMAKATEQSKKDSIELTKLKDELQSQKTELEASQKKLNESQQKRNQLDAECLVFDSSMSLRSLRGKFKKSFAKQWHRHPKICSKS